MSQVMGGAKVGEKDVLGRRHSTWKDAARGTEAYLGDLEAAQYVWSREERGESMKVWGRVKEVGLYGSGYLYRLRMELNLERGEGARETWKSWTRKSGWMEKQRLEEADHLKLVQKRLSTHLGRPLIVPRVTSSPAVDVKL